VGHAIIAASSPSSSAPGGIRVKGVLILPGVNFTELTVMSRSLSVFMDKYKSEWAIRLSLRNFGYANDIFAIPLYAMFCLGEFPQR
jgi:hypothetical protein